MDMQPVSVPDLSARQLHAVLAVAEYNSFIAAAAFLKTSQPALTRTIMRVEDVLGVRLFDRSTNGSQSLRARNLWPLRNAC
jgi:DNA-binding transcriptional LysR family regulator